MTPGKTGTISLQQMPDKSTYRLNPSCSILVAVVLFFMVKKVKYNYSKSLLRDSTVTILSKYVDYGKYGYIRLKLSDNTIVEEHRYVYANHIGRELGSNEHVHHIDHNKHNNDISNLELLTDQEHTRNHLTRPRDEIFQLLVCPACGSTFERTKRYIRDKTKQGQLHFLCNRSCRMPRLL